MTISNAALKKQAEAKVFLDRPKLTYGRYRLKVLAHRYNEGGHYGDTAIAELKVLSSEDLPSFPVSPAGEQCPPERARRVGEVVSYTENTTVTAKGGAGRFQAGLMRLFGLDAPLNMGQLGLVYGEKQPGAYLIVELEVVPKWIDPKGNHAKGIFLKNYRWISVELTPAELAQVHTERAAAQLPPLAETLNEMVGIQ